MTVSRILKLKEKHVTYHYDISTDEQYSKVALDVLKRRHAEGYWYYAPEASKYYVADSAKEMAAIPEDVITQLPQKMKDDISSAKKAIRAAEHSDKQYAEWWRLLQELLALPDEEALEKKRFWTIKLSTGDVEKSRYMAQILFESRGDQQYEGFEIIELDSID